MIKTAVCVVHWPTGPVAVCADHGEQLIGLGRFLGSHIVATAYIGVPVECTNCVNEADRG